MQAPNPNPNWTINHLITDSLDTQNKKNYFYNERNSIVNFVIAIANLFLAGKRIVSIDAPVKCGKKEIAQCMAIYFSDLKAFYATALNRKDVKEQREQLEAYHIDVRIINERGVLPTLETINATIQRGRKVLLILDEDDYGSGKNQKMSALWRRIINNPNIYIVTTSASGEECGSSLTADRPDYQRITYVPPPEYRSAAYFLDNDLVFHPDQAFEKNADGTIHWSEHGRDVIIRSITEQRRMGVFRVCAKGMTMGGFKNARAQLIAELNTFKPVDLPCEIVVIDDKDSFAWEDEINRIGHIHTNKMYIFILKQTCTRGTDLKGWHPYLGFWHDSRSKKGSALNTLIQALLRPTYYTSMPGYGGQEQPIRMYVDRDVLMYVKDKDITAYVESGGKPPMRTKISKQHHHYDQEFFPVSEDEAAAWGDDEEVRERVMERVRLYLRTRECDPSHPENADLFRRYVINKRFDDIQTLFSWGNTEDGDYFSRAFDGHDEPLYLENGHSPAINPNHSAVRLYECYHPNGSLGLILYFWNGKPTTKTAGFRANNKTTMY